MTTITKDIIIGDLLREDQEMAGVLMGMGMHCIGCPASQMESIEEAAIVHGFDPDEFVTTVNDYVTKKQMVADANA
ncbi:MAG TPA: disulfide oxidoreductase [Lachnospiraceae bacterium]|nr:disulfide oxidoreductase [Lachnospiraceae bacterium]